MWFQAFPLILNTVVATDANHGLRFLAGAFFLRISADFAAAFFARAVRSAGVIVSRLRLPPILPPFAPCFLKNSSTSGGSFGLIQNSLTPFSL